MTEIIIQPEFKSGLSKQLLGNFQTDNSCDHEVFDAEVKNGVAYTKNVYYNNGINKVPRWNFSFN